MIEPNPIRVAIIGHTAAMSGAEIALMRLVRALDRERVDPVVLLFSGGPLADAVAELGIPVRILALDSRIATAERHGLLRRALSGIPLLVGLVRFTCSLATLLRRLDVDVVHTNSLKADVIGGLAARLARLPVVWYVHDRLSDDYLPTYAAAAMRWGARHLPVRVLANSAATLQTLQPLPADRSAIAYPGLEAETFAVADRHLSTDAPVVGMIGRISPTKGQDVFLRAAAGLVRTHPSVRFVIVGAALFNEQEYEQQVRVLAVSGGLDGKVLFAGHVTDPGRFLREFSVLVHASPVPEPFGQVIVEAMAAGVPVVASAAGGVLEILGGETVVGRLVPPGDDAALADAVREILDDPPTAALMATRAREYVAKRFRIERTAAVVTSAWLQAAGRNVDYTDR